MRQEEFRVWLCQVKGYKASTAGSRVSNCMTVEKHEGPLDALFKRDQFSALLGKLSYSKEDQHQSHPPRHVIPIDGDIYNGTATLRSAIRLYQEFLGTESVQPLAELVMPPQPQTRKKATGDWPIWEIPSSDTALKMVKMVTPYVRFLHPDIVGAIVENNEKNRFAWRKKLISRGIDPDFYLWEKSSCAFPGIRRYTGSKEIAYYRKQIAQDNFQVSDALRLDDNSFPKHLWSFLFRGKVFQNFGPEGYSLAHLADHKDYKNRRDEEFEIIGEAPEKLYGLYSSASNTAYMPTNLLKLTDFNSETRLLLLNKAQDLYGEICNILPPSLRVKQPAPEWNLGDFEWADPVGAGASLDSFFEFRFNAINVL
ncbi:MAG: hypothetical protein RBR41_08630 [Desulfovibrio sp.]|uniref:hypothetical protein n=1 Tax=Desulfovibrio sp. TaxID=885 RepID=UPI002A35B907|nr:hypothetical protein [Desulfovibrio sp.]MDY0259717.1 hypothetical protein [Desulfovibrio sp.]